MEAIDALREAANCASDSFANQASKVNIFLGYLASPAPTKISQHSSTLGTLVTMLWQGTHTAMTGTHGFQISAANHLISAVRTGVTTTNFEQAQAVLATLLRAYESDSDTFAAQEAAVNALIAAIEAA